MNQMTNVVIRIGFVILLVKTVVGVSVWAQIDDRTRLGEGHRISRLELKNATVVHAARLIAEISGVNVVPTEPAAKKRTTLYLQDVTAKDAIVTMCKVSGLWYRQDPSSATYRVMTTQEYQNDIVVFRDDVIRYFEVLHPNAVTVAQAIEDLYDDRVILSMGLDSDDPLFEERLQTGSIAGGGLGIGGGSGLGGSGGSSSNDSFSSNNNNNNNRRSNTRSNSRSNSRSRLSGRGGGGRGGQRGIRRESFFEETLTTAQIAELERRLAIAEATEAVRSSQLEGLTTTEPPIYVSVVRQHNILIVRTSDAEAMRSIEELVKELDRPIPQVLLEVKILELSLGDDFRSIFDIQVTKGTSTSGPEDDQPANPLSPGAATSPRNVLGLGNFPIEGGASFIYQFLSDDVRARIEMLDQEDRIETLATPMVLASNNRPAAIFIGEEALLTRDIDTDTVTTDSGTSSFVDVETELRQVGTTLIIQPKINADNTVTLTIVQDSSTIKPNGAALPVVQQNGGASEFLVDTVDTRQVSGIVQAKDHLTVAVGGLIRTSVNDVEQKVPLLGDIPLLDLIFKKQIKEKSKTELILLITPHILRSGEQAQEVSRQRIEALSDHRYLENGDEALQGHLQPLLEKRDRQEEAADSHDSDVYWQDATQ